MKFQKTCLGEKFTKKYLERPYDNPNSWGKTYGEHKSHLEFSDTQYRELFRYAQEVGILFTASAMDMVSFFSIKHRVIKSAGCNCNSDISNKFCSINSITSIYSYSRASKSKNHRFTNTNQQVKSTYIIFKYLHV